jgi:GDPmannose 4,6-dehydratase
MKIAAITGITGQDGSILAKQLLKKDYLVESEFRPETFVTRKITKGVVKIKLGEIYNIELGNIGAFRDWGYSPEYTLAMWLMSQQDDPDDYIISTGEAHSVKEFLKEVFDYAKLGNYEKYIKINPIYFRPQEAPYLAGSYDKAKNKLGWEPKVKFKNLIKIMYDYDKQIVGG